MILPPGRSASLPLNALQRMLRSCSLSRVQTRISNILAVWFAPSTLVVWLAALVKPALLATHAARATPLVLVVSCLSLVRLNTCNVRARVQRVLFLVPNPMGWGLIRQLFYRGRSSPQHHSSHWRRSLRPLRPGQVLLHLSCTHWQRLLHQLAATAITASAEMAGDPTVAASIVAAAKGTALRLPDVVRGAATRSPTETASPERAAAAAVVAAIKPVAAIAVQPAALSLGPILLSFLTGASACARCLQPVCRSYLSSRKSLLYVEGCSQQPTLETYLLFCQPYTVTTSVLIHGYSQLYTLASAPFV